MPYLNTRELLKQGVVALAMFTSLGYFSVRGPARALRHRSEGMQQQDFPTFYAATRAWISGGNPYDHTALEATFSHTTPLQQWIKGSLNPPSTFLFLAPLCLLPFSIAEPIWVVLNICFLLAALALLARVAGLSGSRRRVLLLAGAALALASIHTSIALGQLSLALTACIAASLKYDIEGEDTKAGALLGLALALKPHAAAVFLVYHLLVRRWRLAFSAAAVLSCAFAIGAGRLAAAHIPWSAGFSHNVAALVNGPGDPRTGRVLLLGLDVPLSFLVRNRMILEGLTLAIVITVLIAIAVWAGRAPRTAGTVLLAYAALAVLSPLSTYSRIYTASLLLIPLAWLISAYRAPGVRWPEVAAISIAVFIVPGTAMLATASPSLSPAITDNAIWRYLLMPHETYALIALLSWLLVVMYRNRSLMAAPAPATATPRGAPVGTTSAAGAPPFLSVIIPVHNSAAHLQHCLDHLYLSAGCEFECIVVDDGSTDNSAAVARSYGARVVKTQVCGGPARARNLGAREARGEVLFFLDSDVLVDPGSLRRMAADFAAKPELDAVIGSYDDSPDAKDFISQYRNLLHCYVHQHGRSEARTFWGGCGGIRRVVFLEFNGFDESYRRPAIEDIELGYRLSQAGKRILLDHGLTVKHLKRWTLWTMLRTDIRDRGIPWTELILRDRKLPNDLNLQLSQRASVVLTFALVGLAVLTTARLGAAFLLPILALLGFILSRYWIDSAQRLSTGLIPFTAAVLGVSLIAGKLGMMPVVYPVLIGYVLLILRDRYRPHHARWGPDLLFGIYMGLAIVFILRYLPYHSLIFGFFAVVLALIALNMRFYVFLAFHCRRPLFAVAAIPFHLLYHLYNGVSFIAGMSRYFWRKSIGSAAQERLEGQKLACGAPAKGEYEWCTRDRSRS